MQSATEYTRHRLRSRREFAFSALPETKCLGLTLTNAPQAAVLGWLGARLDLQVPTRVAFAHARSARAAASDPMYRSALCGAEAVLPSGPGMALAMCLQRTRLAAGLDAENLVPALCRRIAMAGHGIFLLGGAPGIAEAASDALRRAAPDLIVAGARHGLLKGENEQRLIHSINASGAAVVLVGRGAAEADLWLARNAMWLAAPLTIGARTLFDHLATARPGTKQAPQAGCRAASGELHDDFMDAGPHQTGCAGNRTGLSESEGCDATWGLPTQLAYDLPHRRGAACYGREHRNAGVERQAAAKAQLAAHLWANLPAAPHPSAWH